VSDGSVRAPLLGQTFSPIAGTARLTQGAIQIDGVSIGAPGHALNLQGRVGLAALRPADLDLRLALDHFPLSRSSALETNVNGRLTASGAVGAPHLEGELALDHASLTIGRSDPVLKELRIVGGSQQSGVAGLREIEDRGGDFPERATADVGFSVPRGTWVRSDDASFEVEGRVRVTKQERDVWRWTGQANVVRGTYDLQHIAFEVRRGRVEFTGGTEMDPTLDVVAEHDVGSVTILAVLSGRLSAPVMRLESEPAMPESDVIAYLLFGRPASELGESDQSGVDHAAIAMAAGMAAGELQRMFGEDLPFDTLDVRPERTGGGQIGFGKYLSRDVFVRYGHTVGEESDDEIQIEWRINDRWSVQNTVGRRTSGADIVFGIDY
jgi:translocation and assembly module TamB